MHKLPELEYPYDALSPHISKEVMELHHDKHHQAYVDKLNAALEQAPDLQGKELPELLSDLESVPEEIRTAVRNHGGGHYNHSLFWKWMSPDGGGEPSGELGEAIKAKYGSFQAFVDDFSAQATGLFGSGWTWLLPDLSITTTQNQDTPIMNGQSGPILGLDVWEHAFYPDYKNRKPDYIKAWWNTVNWEEVANRYENAV